MVKIITDSSTLYSPTQARRLGFEVAPLCVHIGDLEGRDLSVDMDAFYGKIAAGEHPRSSQPPIGDVLELYEAHPDIDIINISMADGLSGTYQSACAAKDLAEHNQSITVFNSRTLCGPHRYMVEQAQRMKEAGCSKAEILAWLEKAAKTTESFLIPQDFAFLKRGGRLTPVAAALGSMLKLRPIMRQTDDGKRLDKFAVKRTLKASIAHLIEHFRKVGLDERHILYISHARALADANKILVQFKEAFPAVEYRLLELGAAFVTQGGPQCIAIQYIEK